MKQLAMMSLTVVVFFVYKLVGSDAMGFGFGVWSFSLAVFVALVCWLAVVRVCRWPTLLFQGLLFAMFDAVWRGVSYFNRVTSPSVSLLDGAPIGYFVFVYVVQGLVVFALLYLLQSVPVAVDQWLYLPRWVKAKFGNDPPLR